MMLITTQLWKEIELLTIVMELHQLPIICDKIEVTKLWHQRPGYMNYKSLSMFSKKELVGGLPKLDKIYNTICRTCQEGKRQS